jgi:hypothetical protein
MSYPSPFMFTIEQGLPLLVMSCSDVKRPIAPGALVRFCELYDGPSWRQVKASRFALCNVAAVSALYGFLDPGMAIETYDRKMDAEISARICGTSDHVARMARAIRIAGSAFIVGGALYRELAATAIRVYPELAELVTFASGSYLAQRKQLGIFLRAHQAPIAASAELEAAA